MNQTLYQTRTVTDAVTVNRVLRNTYILLSMTLLFSAAMAFVSSTMNLPIVSPWMVLIGYFGLFFLTNALRNSAWGLLSVFALTGFMGFTLGPILNLYMTALSNGGEIVMMALGSTGVIFLGLSGIALTTKKDFSFMGKFLFVGILVAFFAGVGNLFFQIPALSLAVSSMFVLLMSGLILYQTQQIARGGETNYIMATVTLYISIYNMFMSLLHLFGFGFGDD
jgi:modulator of FtsH protease